MLNLIFDYDGTLHESLYIYAPAFRLAFNYLVKSGFAENREWTNTEISRWIGYSAKNMWEKFMPKLPKTEKEKCGKIIENEMLHLIKEGKARLYSDAITVLQQLRSNGYRLIFLSNCKRCYLEAHRIAFSLDNFFSSFYCTEDYGFLSKTQIFSLIKKEFDGDFIIIGDRLQDINVALKHGLRSIGCAYGYKIGDELKKATAIANNPIEIVSCISEILSQV